MFVTQKICTNPNFLQDGEKVLKAWSLPCLKYVCSTKHQSILIPGCAYMMGICVTKSSTFLIKYTPAPSPRMCILHGHSDILGNVDMPPPQLKDGFQDFTELR